MTSYVPLLSLASLSDPTDVAGRMALAKQVGEAARGSGFMQVVNHGIPEELIREVFDIAEKVFHLPLEEKLLYARNPHTNRGYDLLAGQSLQGAIGVGHASSSSSSSQGAEQPDLKEGWMIGPHGVDERFEYWGRFGHGKNVFPPEERVQGMDSVMERYYNAILDLATRFMKVVALSLGLKEGAFDELCRLPAAAIRLLHYPPELEGTGAGSHTDFGLVTFLATSGAPGLELFIPSLSAWVPVEPAPGAYIVNVGDILALYTGGEYKSSLHRVINRGGVERYSIPFFLDGNSDVLVSPTRGPGFGKYPAVTVEQHLRTKFDASYHEKSGEEIMQAVVRGGVATA